jgi:hypothetical protein
MYTRLVVQCFCAVIFAWVDDEQWHMLLHLELEIQEEAKADIVAQEHKDMQGKQRGGVPFVAMLYIWNSRPWKSSKPFYYADFLVS